MTRLFIEQPLASRGSAKKHICIETNIFWHITFTTFWANTESLQNHFQKALYTEQYSVYRTGWQHCIIVDLAVREIQAFTKVLSTNSLFFYLFFYKFKLTLVHKYKTSLSQILFTPCQNPTKKL